MPAGTLDAFDVALMKRSAIRAVILDTVQTAHLPGLNIASGITIESLRRARHASGAS